MSLLDTNVVSEPMRSKPDQNVLAWLDAQAAESLYLTTISLAELLLGIASASQPANDARRSRQRSRNRSSPCSAIASYRSTSMGPKPMQRSSHALAGMVIPSRPSCLRSFQHQINPVQR